MKHAARGVAAAAMAACLWVGTAHAERDERGAAPTKQTDVMTQLREASPERAAYGNEAKDWGVAQTTQIRAEKLHAKTPRDHPHAATIATRELHALMVGESPPILIDVLGGKTRSSGYRKRKSLPGALWLKGAGLDDARAENVESRLKAKLDALTGGDTAHPVVFFCLSARCWLSYNAAIRAHTVGYTDVYWYRGGVEAWRKAKLPRVRVKETDWTETAP